MNNLHWEEKSDSVLNEVQSKELLKKAGINVVETRLARTKAQAILQSSEIGYPVALKIMSPDINHKTEAGGVRLNLRNASRVGEAYHDMLAAVKEKMPSANIEGVSVQKMAQPGVEIIIGMNRDDQFGPVLMFGLGGIFVEIMKDVSFRLIPVKPLDAKEMIKEIKGYPLLNGYRGQPPADIAELERFIIQVSDFIEDNPNIKELDLNPVIASENEIMAVDARIILDSVKR